MTGMSRYTGKALTGIEHLRQSLEDLLTTPKGSRVISRDYGVRLFDMIDGQANRALITYEVADAIGKFEPRFALKSVDVAQDREALTITVNGVFQGEPLSLRVGI